MIEYVIRERGRHYPYDLNDIQKTYTVRENKKVRKLMIGRDGI